MKSSKLLVLASVVIAGLSVAGFVALPLDKPVPRSLGSVEGDIQRGAYVARLSACITCHTDTRNGGQVLAGGAPIKTPFGTFHAPNITPDKEFGIGNWTLEDFARALTHGESPGGRPYYPAFPYAFFERMTDRDIADLWAAVNSVPPVNKPAPPHDIAFPLSTDVAPAVWQRLFFAPPDEARDGGGANPMDRGAYLAGGPAHCGACHTPRNLLGARDTERRFAGGTASDGEKAPAITADALRQAGWTKKNLIYALRTGLMPDGDSFSGSMARVVNGGTRFWTDGDLDAVATYLFAEKQE
ncbi:MAG: cytochrome c [Rhodospirillales bacterium]|nr:cytochrome c [Rhodospirillales bacterium]MBO6785909.1 cytochrome c [Rhodospirillales bacterium]